MKCDKCKKDTKEAYHLIWQVNSPQGRSGGDYASLCPDCFKAVREYIRGKSGWEQLKLFGEDDE